MKVLIRTYNFNDDKEEEFLCHYTANTTLYEAFNSVGIGYFELQYWKYYKFGYQCCNSSVHYGYFQIPYVITDKEVIWMPSYKDVKIVDFIRTTGYPEVIEAYVDIPSAGSLIFQSIAEMWEYYTPILTDIVLLVNLSTFGIKFIWWLKQKFSETIPPLPFMDFIDEREGWNHHELSQLLNIPEGQGKHLLKGLAFEWDNSKKMYMKTLKTDEFIKHVKKIPWDGDGE